MENVKISYVIMSYNHEKYIKRAIDSILNQTYENIELLVCDDKSKDQSHKFLEQYSAEKNFVYVQNEENQGIVATINRLLEMASGEYIGFLGSDDWIKEDKVKKQLEYIQKTSMDAVYGPIIEYIEDKDRYISRSGKSIEQIILDGNLLQHLYETGEGAGLLQSGLFRTACAKKIQFLKGYKSDDYLFQIRFLQAGYKVGYLNEPLTYYRIHSCNTHKNALYCLYELELPVIKDFIPGQYQKNLMADAYCRAAAKLIDQSKVAESIKLRKGHIFPYKFERVKMLMKADLRFLMKKFGVYGLYQKIRYH